MSRRGAEPLSLLSVVLRRSSRRHLWSLLLVLGFSAGCLADDPNPSSTCDFIAFVRLGGIRYTKSATNDGLAGINTGDQQAQVIRDVTRDVDDCRNYQPTNGDSAHVRPGTRFYSVDGYRADFLLATNVNGRGDLWEADLVPHARTGADLLDIASGLQRVTILSDLEDTIAVGVIDDPEKLNQLVDGISSSPVDQYADQRGEIRRYIILFEMIDGLVFRRTYRPDTGELSGIFLPEETQQLVLEAIAP